MTKYNLQNFKSYFLRHKVKLSIAFLLAILYFSWLPSTLFNKPCSTVLLDENNELLAAQIASDGQWRFPEIENIPEKFEKCILHFEDEYFYYHPGVNPVSIIKSLKRNFTSHKIISGGSTITMQIARLMYENKSRNYFQKIKEILLAVRMECSYKKSSLLKIYASNAPFGSNVVGLSAASWRYFGRAPDKLSWAESALLAVLPNAPSLIYPGKNHKALLEKRNRLLKKLYDSNTIDNSTYQLSLQEELPKKPVPLPQIARHLLNKCIVDFGKSKVYKTSINKALQIHANAILNEHIQTLSSNQIQNACVLIAETESGKIKAYIGNSYSLNNNHQNFVDIIQAPRSTGSILKPFLYAAAINEANILPKTLLEDVPTQIGSYGPKNFHLTYDGLVPADEAIARSLNVPAVKLLLDYGTPKFHYKLKQLGFTTFTKPSTHYGLSLVLGGGEASLHEIASAYASMGRALSGYNNSSKKYTNNNYRKLTYLKTESSKNNHPLKSDLYNASSIWYTFNAMTELMRPQDYVGWMRFLSKHKIAWKTGTSFGFRDAWAVGLDKNNIVAVWVGNADGEGRPELTGSAAAAPLMFNIFNILPNKQWYTKPSSDMIKLTVCKQSGFKASDICPDTEQRDCQFGGEKTQACPFHKIINLDETETYRVNSNCYPVNKMKQKAWFVATPSQEYFLIQKNIFYKPLPPYLPNCQTEGTIRNLEIIYPREGFKVYIPRIENGQLSQCVLKATHKSNASTLFWHLDGNYIGSTQKFHQIATVPTVGKHTLMITDSEGETNTCRFEVIGK